MFNYNKMSDTEEPVVSDVVEEPAVTEVVEDVAPEEVPEESAEPEVPAESEEVPAEEVAEPEVSAEEVPAAPSTEEVVETVQSMLSEPIVSSSEPTSLEERVKLLEERFEKLVQVLKESWVCENSTNTKGGKFKLFSNLQF